MIFTSIKRMAWNLNEYTSPVGKMERARENQFSADSGCDKLVLSYFSKSRETEENNSCKTPHASNQSI